jgi:transposase
MQNHDQIKQKKAQLESELKHFSNANQQLENENKKLQYKTEHLESENKKLELKIKWYEEQLRLNAKNKYGKSSEQTSNQLQLDLFNEAESLTTKLTEPEVEFIQYERNKRRKEKQLDLSDLPVETIEYTIEDTDCPSCASHMHVMTKEIRKELKVIPAQLTVIEHVSYVYACRNCERHDTKTPIIKAPSPNAVIPKSLVSPSLLAFIMNKKYVEAVPLYRQEQQFNHLGISFLRQNLANWIIKGSKWLEHIYQRMHTHLLKEDVLHAAETTLQVLHEKNRKAEKTSYMWVYLSGHTSIPICLYDYQETRAHKHPEQFLNTFKGYLHVDGYQAYNNLKDVTLIACGSHARRKFHEAVEAAPNSKETSYQTAHQGLDYYNRLFKLEKDMKNKSPEEKYELRKTYSESLFDELKKWLNVHQELVTPKSKLGQAIKYSLNQWNNFIKILDDGRLEFSNNRAERAIKPFVIGRKNWLFANTAQGARASAVIYSVIETAKLNHCSPFKYLEYLFHKLPNMTIDQASLDLLMPWSDKIPDSIRIKVKDEQAKENISGE